MTGERQFATESVGGRGVACGAGWLPYERPGVSQKWISAVSCQDKTISVAGCRVAAALLALGKVTSPVAQSVRSGSAPLRLSRPPLSAGP